MDAKHAVRGTVQSLERELVKLSEQIHSNPEIGFEEEQASAWVAEALAAHEFKVDRGVAGLPTALRATFGNGSLNIGICAEYDALPRVGHACGHNIIASAAVGAAVALARVADDFDLTITVLGTPAEEGGGGKVFMLQRGAFDGLHAAMMVHPSPTERSSFRTLATSQYDIEFFGKAAHASSSPHRGISASAALALSQSGIGMLREHLRHDDRVHGIVRHGGDAPNVVPDHTTGRWFVRSSNLAQLEEVAPRVVDVFKGAALMTGCTLEMKKYAPSFAELQSDQRMEAIWRTNAEVLGRKSLPIQPTDGFASTDMGNVSHAIPSIHPVIEIESHGANIHEAAFRDAAIGISADKAVLDAAAGMAMTAIDIAEDLSLRDDLVATPYQAAAVPADENAYLGYDFDKPIRFDPNT